MRLLLLNIMAIFLALNLNSQNLSDALRYSIFDFSSTARFTGVGGAFAAMGADFGVINYNPAGLGEFRKSEFTISPLVNYASTNSRLQNSGNALDRSRSSFSLGNLGLVFNHRPIASSWKSTNFAIGFNQIANFNQRFEYSGTTTGSITERFSEVSNGLEPEQLDVFEGQPAFVAGAIFDFDEDLNYDTDFIATDRVDKRQVVERSGSINELTLGLGGNLDEKISIGVTLGIPFVSFEEDKEYTETDNGDAIPIFDELIFAEYVNTTGVGINGKLGVLFKPSQYLRIGAAIHSPSYFFLTDDFRTDITYAFTQDGTSERFNEPSPDGNFKWRLSTPFRVIGGIGSIFRMGNLAGFIDADVEWVDYSNNSFNLTANSSDPFDQQLEDDLNRQVTDQLSSALNFKLGTELAYEKLRFRAGIAFLESPYSNSSSSITNAYSGGIGYRGNKIFLDFAFRYRERDEDYTPYLLLDESRNQSVSTQSNQSSFNLTVGFKL